MKSDKYGQTINKTKTTLEDKKSLTQSLHIKFDGLDRMSFNEQTIGLRLVLTFKIVLAQIYLSKAFDNVDLDAPQFTQSLHYENVEKTLQWPALAHDSGQDNRLQPFMCTLLIIVNCRLNWETGVPQGSTLCPLFLLVQNNLCCLVLWTFV